MAGRNALVSAGPSESVWQRFEPLSERVFRYGDTCNVYVIRAGDRAVLIDLGAGTVLERIAEIGVRSVDWVLHTHHHRDQCQGVALLGPSTRVGVPEREARHFSDVEAFWQQLDLDDRYLCANVFSTLPRSIRVDRELCDYDRFVWLDLSFTVLPTPGHTRGAVTYLVEVDGIRYGFCGDLIFGPGRVWSLHDLQWDYSSADGLSVAIHSVEALRSHSAQRLAPSHGETIDDVDRSLAELSANLRRLHDLSGRGYEGDTRWSIAGDTQTQRVSEHLVAVTNTSANFYALTSRTGKTLLFDYGFAGLDHANGAETRFVEHSLDELAQTFGIREIDVVVPTHYHDDHVAGIPFLQTVGAKAWVPELFADLLERPHDYRLPALWREPIRVDRRLRESAPLEWKEFSFETRQLPGHTWFAIGFFGEIDGRRVAITSDEIQRDLEGRLRLGGPVYRNVLYSGDFLKGLRTIIEFEPELLLTGHDGPVEVTPADLEGVYDTCRELEGTWRALAAFPAEVNFTLDPAFAELRPYRQVALAGEVCTLDAHVRNHHSHEAEATVRLVVPHGWEVRPAQATLMLDAGENRSMTFEVVPGSGAELGIRHVVVADLVLGEHAFGQACEALLTIHAARLPPGADGGDGPSP